MEISEVKELLAKFDDSSLTEFDLKEGSFELYMNKNKTSRVVEGSVPKVETATAAVSHGETETVTEAVEQSGELITSPIVGVAYLKPAPDQEPFKKVGDPVKKGDILCIIEAMKLMNEIVSDYDGVVQEVLVENETIVEFNQPLFRIG